jgi:subtilisin family serine protease
MKQGEGSPEVVVGMLDGPVAIGHPDLAAATIRGAAGCSQTTSAACRHGTFTAGILSAKRESMAPAICPGCTLLVRPIFKETTRGNVAIPSASVEELTEAIVECIDGGAHVLNLSVAFCAAVIEG